MLSAQELYRRGRVLGNSGRHAAAKQHLLKAAPRAESAELRARIELSLAYTESELGTHEAGIRLCESALTYDGITPLVRGLIWSQLGLLFMRSGHGEEALAALARSETFLIDADATVNPEQPAIEIGIEDDRRQTLANVYLSRGNVELQRRHPLAAQHSFLAASQQYRAAHDAVGEIKANHNLGYATLMSGDIVAALRLMEQADLASLGPVWEAVSSQDRAEALLAAGMDHDAAASLRDASRAFANRGMRHRQAEALLVLARLLLRTNPRDCARTARRAAALFEARGFLAWAARAHLVALSGDLSNHADNLSHAKHRELAVRASELETQLRHHRLHVEAQTARLLKVRALVGSEQLEVARRELQRVRVRAEAPLENRLLIREVRAEYHSRRGYRGRALYQVRLGLTDLQDWQSSFGSLDFRSSLVGHGRALAQAGLEHALDDGRPRRIFEWAQRTRALASQVAPLRSPVSLETAEALQQLRGLQERQQTDGTTAVARQISALRRDIRQRAWQTPGSGQVSEIGSLEHVRQVLAETDGILLSHVTDGRRLRLLTVTGRRTKVFDLGPLAPVLALLPGLYADLDVAAGHLPRQLHSMVMTSLTSRLAALDRAILAPAAAEIGDLRVVAVPTGSLAGVPWSMLASLRENPLSVARSVSSWLGDRGPHPLVRPTDAVGFVAGPRVPRAQEEVQRAASFWRRAEVICGEQATATTASELAGRVQVLHFSAHGRHSSQNPLFSALELSDGPWYGYDIDNLAHVPPVVILSACELGRSSVRWGEEAVGMTMGWQCAGTKVVIAAAASVDDDAACEVLSHTHQRLAEGDTPSEALLAAQRACADVVTPFVCFGTGW